MRPINWPVPSSSSPSGWRIPRQSFSPRRRIWRNQSGSFRRGMAPSSPCIPAAGGNTKNGRRGIGGSSSKPFIAKCHQPTWWSSAGKATEIAFRFSGQSSRRTAPRSWKVFRCRFWVPSFPAAPFSSDTTAASPTSLPRRAHAACCFSDAGVRVLQAPDGRLSALEVRAVLDKMKEMLADAV